MQPYFKGQVYGPIKSFILSKWSYFTERLMFQSRAQIKVAIKMFCCTKVSQLSSVADSPLSTPKRSQEIKKSPNEEKGLQSFNAKKPLSSHEGEIITMICLEPECQLRKNQLCCAVCVVEEHQNHNLESVKALMPELLMVHKRKTELDQQFHSLIEFTKSEFGSENEDGEDLSDENIVSRVQNLLLGFKEQLKVNNEELSKMKQIFKTLNKNNTTSGVSSAVVSNSEYTVENQKRQSTHRQNSHNYEIKIQKPFGSTGFNSERKPPNPSVIKGNQAPQPCLSFSHSYKHPYITVKNDAKTATKSSHPGHKYCILGSRPLTPQFPSVYFRVDKSTSHNILLGLCHSEIVREKEYANVYGVGNGTYLIGQNGFNSHIKSSTEQQSPAISFHHSLSVMNRKEIVGWNFGDGEGKEEDGDVIEVKMDFNEYFMSFIKHPNNNRSAVLPQKSKTTKLKAKKQEFQMPLCNQNSHQEVEKFRGMLNEPGLQEGTGGLRPIVLLQNVDDQVTILNYFERKEKEQEEN